MVIKETVQFYFKILARLFLRLFLFELWVSLLILIVRLLPVVSSSVATWARDSSAASASV